MKVSIQKKQEARRTFRLSCWILLYIIIISAECIIIRSMIFWIGRSNITDIIAFQLIIPIVSGFAIAIGLVGRNLVPDLYDSYSKTSSATIMRKVRRYVELYNQFSEERGEKHRIEIVNKKGGNE